MSIRVSMFYNGPDIGFDRAKSNRVDSTVGDDRKSSKKRKRKRRTVRIGSLNTA